MTLTRPSPARLVAAFAQLLDLDGADGRPSFNKLVILTVTVAHLVGRPFPLGLATLLVSASFGRAVLLAFLGRSTFQLRESSTLGRAARDPELGVEATP